MAPVAGSANGVVVVPRYYYDDELLENLKLTFKEGLMTSMSAKSGDVTNLQKAYDAAGVGRDEFSFVDFGINPNIKSTPMMQVWTSAGSVALGIGGNLWAGGTNRSAFAISGFLNTATVKLDGKTLVDKGTLKTFVR
jgi:hypothetical protein